MQKPTFTKQGAYDLSTPEKRLAAAVDVIKNMAVMCPQAYYSKGPEYVREQMVHIGRSFLEALQSQERKDADGSCDPVDALGWQEMLED